MKKICCLLIAATLAAASPGSAETGPLRILVFGATGGVGTHIVDEALDRGHRVTAVSRDPSSITKQHENLVAARGDLLDPESIERLLREQDVVIASVRGVIGGTLMSLGFAAMWFMTAFDVWMPAGADARRNPPGPSGETG